MIIDSDFHIDLLYKLAGQVVERLQVLYDNDVEEVQEKARAAKQWCEYANEHARQFGGKEWAYLLIPHDEIRLGASVEGLARQLDSM